MRYFKTSDPDDLSQGALSDRVHFLKCEEEGIKLMCKVTEEIYEIGKEEGREKKGCASERQKKPEKRRGIWPSGDLGQR